MKGKRLLALIAGAAVFSGVIYSLGLRETLAALAGARWGYAALTVLFFAGASYVRLWKWLLMRGRTGAGFSFAEMNGVFFFSKFWGLVSPMRSGEVAPAFIRGGGDGGRGGLLAVILYDRVLETLQSLIVFVALFFLLYGEFFNVGMGYALAGVALALGVFTFFILSKRAGECAFAWSDSALSLFGGMRPARALKSFLAGVKGGLEGFYSATRSYFSPAFSLLLLSLTFAAWALDMGFWFALFKAFNINTSIVITIISVVAYTMVAAISPTPNGLGVSDLSFALILRHFGYSGEVGGLIIVSRLLVLGYTFLGYMLFAHGAVGRERA